MNSSAPICMSFVVGNLEQQFPNQTPRLKPIYQDYVDGPILIHPKLPKQAMGGRYWSLTYSSNKNEVIKRYMKNFALDKEQLAKPAKLTVSIKTAFPLPIKSFPSSMQSTNDNCKQLQQLQQLHWLFKRRIKYRMFFHNTLSRKDLNNYDLKSYLNFLSPRFRLIVPYNTLTANEIDYVAIKAGKIVYEAITNLYVTRFLEKHPQLNKKQYFSSLHTIALGIAIKCSWDEGIMNKDFVKFISPEMKITTYQEMETEFLKGIDWNISTEELCTIDISKDSFVTEK